MTSKVCSCSFAATLLLVTVAGFWPESDSVQAAPAVEDNGATEAVESDMHEFMEYYFQPTFKRLKPAMATAPTNNQGWKAIKADGLILAEGGNLLLGRQPQDDTADWVKHSEQVRTYGGKLYRAAKAKNYADARKNYESMVQNCNACHHQFAGGEHILTP